MGESNQEGGMYRNLYHYSPDYFHVLKTYVGRLRPEKEHNIGDRMSVGLEVSNTASAFLCPKCQN